MALRRMTAPARKSVLSPSDTGPAATPLAVNVIGATSMRGLEIDSDRWASAAAAPASAPAVTIPTAMPQRARITR